MANTTNIVIVSVITAVGAAADQGAMLANNSCGRFGRGSNGGGGLGGGSAGSSGRGGSGRRVAVVSVAVIFGTKWNKHHQSDKLHYYRLNRRSCFNAFPSRTCIRPRGRFCCPRAHADSHGSLGQQSAPGWVCHADLGCAGRRFRSALEDVTC